MRLPIPGLLKQALPAAAAVPYNLGHDSMLHALEARRGRGKSYTLTRIAYLSIARGVPVLTNSLSIKPYAIAIELCREGVCPNLVSAIQHVAEHLHFMRVWDNILTAFDCVVIFDESTRLFDGRRNMAVSVPAIIYEWIKQSRKVKCTVYFVAHSITWLDQRIQHNLDLYWQVRKVSDKKRKAPDGTPYPLSFHLYGLNPGGVGRVENINREMAELVCEFRFDARIARMYHSQELINEVSGTPSFSSMDEIKAYHRALGRDLGSDGEEELRHHLERLTGSPGVLRDALAA